MEEWDHLVPKGYPCLVVKPIVDKGVDGPLKNISVLGRLMFFYSTERVGIYQPHQLQGAMLQ